MRNPLASEDAAFRFVLGTLVYLAPIVVAAWIATWLGMIVFVAMSVLAFVVLKRGTAAEPPVVSTERASVEDTQPALRGDGSAADRRVGAGEAKDTAGGSEEGGAA